MKNQVSVREVHMENKEYVIEEIINRMERSLMDGDQDMLLKVVQDGSLYEKFYKWSMKMAERKANSILYTLFWLKIRRLNFNLLNAEMVEKFLDLASEEIEREARKEGEIWLVEILKEVETYLSENLLGYNKKSISDFLFRTFLKLSKATKTTKIFAFELYTRVNGPVGRKVVEDVLHEFEGLDEFSVDGVRFKDVVVLSLYGKALFQNSEFVEENHACFVNLLFRQYFVVNGDTSVSSSSGSLFGYPTPYSRLMCVSFLYFFKELKNITEEVDIRPLEIILRSMILAIKEKEYTPEEVLYFLSVFGSDKPRVIIIKLFRSVVLLLLQIMNNKKHQNRVRAARILCKVDLGGMSLGKKVGYRISKIAKKHIRGNLSTITEGAINILSQVNPEFLLMEMQKPHPVTTRRKIFDKIKDKFQCSESYRAYMDLLSNEESRGVEYRVKDIKEFAKVFYHYEKKYISKFLEISIEGIEDVFIAELAASYSEFHPHRIDEVYVASILLEGGGEIVKSRNVSFYEGIIRVLINLHKKISATLKKRLVAFLRRLVFYSPYTKNAGMLINVLGYGAIEFPRKTDYFITILGSCGHPDFREYLSEYPWTFNKERGLVYSLRFNPELGVLYKWKLEEILRRLDSDLDEKGSIVCVELLIFLRETIGSNVQGIVSDFIFELVAKSHHFIVSGVRSNVLVISKESCALLSTATRARAILPHVSIPVIFSFHSVSAEIVKAYPEATISSIQTVVENKVLLFKKKRGIPELSAIYEIYASLPDKSRIIERIPHLFDSCPVRAYYLLAQIIRFDYRDTSRILKVLSQDIHSHGSNENKLLLKIYTLFLEFHVVRRSASGRRICISDEKSLFDEALSDENIEKLELCFQK